MSNKSRPSLLKLPTLLTRRSYLAFALCLGMVALAGCQTADDGRLPTELQKIESKLSVQRLWKTSVGSDAQGLGFGLQPDVKDGVVFVAGSKGRVRALDAKSGRVLWTQDTEVNLSAGPAVGAGRVVLGSNKGDVIALDAQSGKTLWRAKLNGEILAAPGVGAEQVAVRTANGAMNVLSASSGNTLWISTQEIPRLSLRGASAPLVTSGVVIAGSDAGKISSYNALDGAVVWERLLGLPRGTTELERLVDIDGKIELSGADLFAVGYNTRLAKLDARSGNIVWSKKYSSATGVSLALNKVYLSDFDGQVVALDQDSGSEVWKNDEYKYRNLNVPVTTARAVVVGDFEGYVHFLSPDDGSTLARMRVSKSALRVPAVSEDDRVYVQADDGTVVALKINELKL